MLLNILMKIEELKELGFDEKQLKILFALRNGPLSGPELEKASELRQPEVARAVRELRAKGYVKLLKSEKRFKCGAPCKIWALTVPFEQIIREIVSKKLVELDKKLRICVSVLFEVGDSIENIDPEIIEAIRKLNDKDIWVVELKSDSDANS
jgi:predicted transcriptional regulator